ncbi:MAG: CcdB family protein [Mariprofundaceae bacterium]|nr:CcdB family protein [Mariprofundaceae bacterium]
MAQFSLYQNHGESSDIYPFFVDVQNEILDSLNSRLVIPMTPVDKVKNRAPKHLCPTLHIDEGDFVLLTHQMTSVPASILTSPIHSLEAFRDDIIQAVDFLITGI